MCKPAKQWFEQHIWEFPAVRDLFWISLGITFLWIGYELRTIFTPVLIAFAIAYLVNPIISTAENNYQLPRPATISGLLLLFVLLLIGIGVCFGPVIVKQSMQFVHHLPGYLNEIAFMGMGIDDVQKKMDAFVKAAEENPSTLMQPIMSRLGAIMGFASGFIDTTIYLITSLILIPIYFFFFSWRYDPMLRQARDYIPEKARDSILDLVHKFDVVFGSFVRGRVVIGMTQSVLFCIGYWLIDLPYWFLVGLFSGLLCMLPIVGFIGWPFAILLKYIDAASGDGSSQMDLIAILVWPSVVYGIIQGIETFILTPYIQGHEMKMNPVTILIVIFIGGGVGGLYGVLLAVPLAACARILFDEVLQPRLEKWAADT